MTFSAVIGKANGVDAREVGSMAARQAVEKLGRAPVILGLVMASAHLPLPQVLSGMSALLGDTPLWGMSTSAEISAEGVDEYSVILVLLSSDAAGAAAEWQADFGSDSRQATQKLMQILQPGVEGGTLLVAADGFQGDAREMCAVLPAGKYQLAGCLAGSNLQLARTYQLGGRQAGSGGLAAAYLSAGVATSIGRERAWEPVGSYFKVTQAQGPWIRRLDNRHAAEVLAELFGYTPREWSFPPLNELVRLYPLGLEREQGQPLIVRAPLRVETDGSLRMHTLVPEDSIVQLMIGSMSGCLAAAETAAQQALDGLQGAPMFALVLMDIAWQMLMQTQPGAEIAPIRKVLGPDVLIAGGYTYGQIARLGTGAPELFNHQIEIVLFGNPAA